MALLWLLQGVARAQENTPRTATLFGDCLPKGMTVATTTAKDGITTGTLQPQVLRRPTVERDLYSDDNSLSLPLWSDSRYALYTFDTVVAHSDGYYYYHYAALNDPTRLITDSVYVHLKRGGGGDDDDPPYVPDTSYEPTVVQVPKVVNLVIIDHHGYHTFKVLNTESYTSLSLTLFDARGFAIYRSDDYKNDYDMSTLDEGTYYYTLEAHTAASVASKKGFVELIKP